MEMDWIDEAVRKAVSNFWAVRDGGTGVQGGKTLDSFIEIIRQVVQKSGLENAEVFTGKYTSELPGFFRPHKSWDAVVISDKKLVAAIELKSQVGSIGNNFNNRSEEVLGSSIDLKAAIEESAFGKDAEVFTGYLILVEKSEKTLKTPKINMNFFPVMPGFLLNENERNKTYKLQNSGKYPRTDGISYLARYDELCKRLVSKDLYTAASIIAAPNENHAKGDYEDVSAQTSIETFLLRLSNHCEVIASINNQRTSN